MHNRLPRRLLPSFPVRTTKLKTVSGWYEKQSLSTLKASDFPTVWNLIFALTSIPEELRFVSNCPPRKYFLRSNITPRPDLLTQRITRVKKQLPITTRALVFWWHRARLRALKPSARCGLKASRKTPSSIAVFMRYTSRENNLNP